MFRGLAGGAALRERRIHLAAPRNIGFDASKQRMELYGVPPVQVEWLCSAAKLQSNPADARHDYAARPAGGVRRPNLTPRLRDERTAYSPVR
jgi:hypothetical protein